MGYKFYLQLAIVGVLIIALWKIFPFDALTYTSNEDTKENAPVCALVKLDLVTEKSALAQARTSWQRQQENVGDRVDLLSTSLSILGVEEVVATLPKAATIKNDRAIFHPNTKPKLLEAPKYPKMELEVTITSEMTFSKTDLLQINY